MLPEAVKLVLPDCASTMLPPAALVAEKSMPEIKVGALMPPPLIVRSPAARIWLLTSTLPTMPILPWLVTLPAWRLAAFAVMSPAERIVPAVALPETVRSVAPVPPSMMLPPFAAVAAKSTPETRSPALRLAPSIERLPADSTWPLASMRPLAFRSVLPWLVMLLAVRSIACAVRLPADNNVPMVRLPLESSDTSPLEV